jgi:Kef-type K+ transport system membrane component KefB
MGTASVLGELLVGIGAGNLLPPLFGEQGIAFVRGDPTLHVLAEIGVLIFLFDVGLEADLRALIRVGPSAALVAVIGVVIPFGLGWATAHWLVPETSTLAHLFVGATLTATSVGITARVLKDLGALQSPEGQVILGAAILDDILGLVVLGVMSGLVTATATGGAGLSGIAFTGIVLKAVAFLGVTGRARPLRVRTNRPVGGANGPAWDPPRLRPGALLHVGVCRGASGVGRHHRRLRRGIAPRPLRGRRPDTSRGSHAIRTPPPPVEPVRPALLRPHGHQVDLGSLVTPDTVAFGGVLMLVAVAGKLACATGVVGRGINRLAVGIGMVPRGEVGLIFAGIGAALTLDGQPLLSQATFSALVLMVVVMTLLTPVGLRRALGRANRPVGPERPSGKREGPAPE